MVKIIFQATPSRYPLNYTMIHGSCGRILINANQQCTLQVEGNITVKWIQSDETLLNFIKQSTEQRG